MNQNARWELLRISIEQPFALFHASVTICIVRQMLRKDHGFNTAFFKLYVLQTIVDLAVYYSWLLNLRLPRAGIATREMSDGAYGTVTSVVAMYSELLKYSLHVLISANRYRVIRDPTRQERLWVLVTCLTLPALVRVGYTLYSDYCITSSADVNGCIRRLIVMIYVVPLVYSAMSASICIVLDVRTFLTFKAYNAVRRLQHREDFLLLRKLYSILQFIFMLVMTISNGAMALQFLLMQDPRWLHIPHAIISYNFDVVCFSGPFCLLSTSERLRYAYLSMLLCVRKSSQVHAIELRQSSSFLRTRLRAKKLPGYEVGSAT